MKPNFLQHHLLISLLFILFTGCASAPKNTGSVAETKQNAAAQTSEEEKTSTESQPTSEVDSTQKQPEIETPKAEFETQTLYDLMIAELAGKRNRLDIALGNYMKQAHETKDLNIIKRYAMIANYMRAQQATLDATQLWLQATPTDPDAHNLMVMYKVRNKAFENIGYHFRQLLSQKPSSLEYDFILLQIRKYTPEEQTEFYSILDTLSQSYPEQHTLVFLMATIQEQQKEFGKAIDLANQALDIDPKFTPAVLLKVDILGQEGKTKEALSLLRKAAYSKPVNKKLRLIYARTLIRNKDYKEAQKEFTALVKKYPKDSELLMTLAILSAENKMYEQAESALTKLINLGRRLDDAYLYLGQVKEAKEEYKEAIQHLLQVKKIPLYTQAQIRIANIYAQMGEVDSAKKQLQRARQEDESHASDYLVRESELIAKYESDQDAFDFLTTHIESHFDDPNIRYARAMTAEKLDRIDILEEDLRHILAGNPKSAIALNALGYTLADRSLKLDEALSLIKRALEIKPDDPAILDSLGWVYFRQGNFEQAIIWLGKAYHSLQDPEIAAHYAEVLWVTGKKEEAIKVCKENILLNPDHKALNKLKKTYNFSL